MNIKQLGLGFLFCLGLMAGSILAATPVMIVSGRVRNQAAQLLSGLQVKVDNLNQQRQVTATSDADGIYRAVFFDPDQNQAVGIAQAGDQMQLRVYAQDQTLLLDHTYQLTEADINLNLARADLEITFAVQGDPTQQTAVVMVSGRIMTADGGVLSRVKLRLENLTQQRQLEVTSNAEGVYRAIFFAPSGQSATPVAQAGDELKLQAFSPEGAVIHSQQLVLNAGQIVQGLIELDLQLPSSAEPVASSPSPLMIISGKITDSKGQALPALRVWVENQSRQKQLEVTTDDEGVYRAVFFAPGQSQAQPVAAEGDQLQVEVLQADGAVWIQHQHQLSRPQMSDYLLQLDLQLPISASLWSSSITVSSKNAVVQSQQLQLGMSSQASADYDDGLDVVAPPSPQEPVMLDAYLELADPLLPRLSSDFRPDSSGQVYTFRVRADQDAFSLSWDLSLLPDQFSWVQLMKISPAPLQQIDLQAQEADFGPRPAEYYTFQLSLGQGIEIALAPGWNMISIPGHPLETAPDSLQTADNSLILPLYRWNPASFNYQAVSELKFGEGYWALTINPQGTTLQLSVSSRHSYSRQLEPGWNMIGSVSQQADFSAPQDEPEGAIIGGTLYSWNPANFSYASETEILPGQGYWVLTLAECQLTVGGQVGGAPASWNEPRFFNHGQTQGSTLPTGVLQVVDWQAEKGLPPPQPAIDLAIGDLEVSGFGANQWQRLSVPQQTRLLPNYPNPFNPETWIPFQLSQDAAVTVTIYDVQGQRIRQLQLGQVTAGRYVTADQAAYWDGKSETGQVVASGTYFYKLRAGDYTETRKMVILK